MLINFPELTQNDTDEKVIELTQSDIKYFDTLINSIVVSGKYIEFIGRNKRLNQNDPFYTIMNEQTWSKNTKIKYEKYILMKFKSTEKFNDWCMSKTPLQLTSSNKKDLFFADDDDFSLVFIRNGIFLDCYGYDDKSTSKQVKFVASSQNSRTFEDAIISYLRYHSNLKSLVEVRDRQALYMLKKELTQGKLIYEGKIKQISNYYDTYCLAYIPLEHLTPNGKPTPTWNIFLSQFDKEKDRKLFRAWVYSIFVEDDYGRQILWVEGNGYNGKSTVASVIGEILASYNPLLFNSIKIDPENNKINLVNFDKCRFVVFSNAILNSNLLHREEILLLTGNDYTTIKRLYHDPENKKVFSKIMINSNYAPIYNAKMIHESTRLIHLKMDPEKIKISRSKWGEHKLSFGDRLKKEFKDFMRKARLDYKELIQSDGLLKT